MEEIFETLRKQIKGDFDQNNIIIILDNSISFVYLSDIDWEEDQIDEILGQISEIKEQLELKQNQLIKNLILSNQINNVTPTQF